MIPKQLTAEDRLSLLANIARLEQEVQEEGGFTWQELRDKYEKEMDTILTNTTNHENR